MADNGDYYGVLGLSKSATADEIRSAYRKLARKLHPDVNKAPDAAKRFGRVQEAYDVLSDAEKRRLYDQFGVAGVRGGPDAAAAASAGARHRSRTSGQTDFGGFHADDFSSIFEQFMGGGGPGPGRRQTAARGADVEHTIQVPFLTAVRGGSEQLRIGHPDGRTETVDVQVPPGIDAGSKLRLRGKGQPGRQGGRPGDLILNVEVASHPWFRREGLDVFIDVPITIAEAALGTVVSVPLLDGRVQLTVPPGTSSGRKLRFRERGIRNAAGNVGDFYAVIEIAAPGGLTDADREALAAMATRLKNPRDSMPWTDKMG